MRPDIVAWLPNLPSIILVDPWRAVAYLRRMTAPASDVPDPGRRVDAWSLLAELELHLARANTAIESAKHACTAARTLQPFDANRHITACAITADIAVRTGAPNAADTVLDYYTAITDHDPEPDSPAHRHRLLLAAGLLAVAAYHQDCAAGREQLAALHHAVVTGPTWDAGLAMVAGGLLSMQSLCDGRDLGPRGDPPPMPDGLLHATVSQPPDGYLADRVSAVQPHHTCRPPTDTPAQPASSHASSRNTGAASVSALDPERPCSPAP